MPTIDKPLGNEPVVGFVCIRIAVTTKPDLPPVDLDERVAFVVFAEFRDSLLKLG